MEDSESLPELTPEEIKYARGGRVPLKVIVNFFAGFLF